MSGPTLISSNIGGKQTAPKAPPRRRAPPPPASKPPPKEPSPVPPLADPTPPPPSPPPTQQQQDVQSAPAAETSEPRTPSPPVEQRPPTPGQSQPTPAAPAVEETPTTQSEEAQPAVPTTRANKGKRSATGTEESARAPKRAKRSSARSNAQVQSRVNEDGAAKNAQEPVIDPQLQQSETDQQPETTGAPKKATTKRKTPAKRTRRADEASANTVVASGDETQAEGQEGNARKRRKTARKGNGRKGKKSTSDGATTGEGAQATGEQPHNGDAEAGEEDEGSDPELHEIDPNTVMMSELARANKYGKTSEREKKMAEINWEDVIAKRREAEEKAVQQAELEKQRRQEAQPGDDPIRPNRQGRNATAEPASTQTEKQTEQQDQDDEQDQSTQVEPEGGLQFKIVNGQIVEDESTLMINNQSQVQAEADAATTEAVEENDLTVRINNHSFLNSRKRDEVERALPVYRSKSDPWTDEETERFYEALKMFGTDFLIISKMFPGKTRPQIKKKFIREERLDLTRVNNALLGRDTNPTPMNLEYYARESGLEVSHLSKFTTHEEAMARIKDDMREKEEELRQRLAEAAEDKRQAEIAEKEREAARKGARKAAKKGKGAKGKKGGMGMGTLGGGGPVEEGGSAE